MTKCFPPLRPLLPLFLLLLIAPIAFTQDLATYERLEPQALFEQSWRSTSQSEKVAIRTFLAKKHPGTPAGILARAWLANHEGREDEAIKLYRECVTQHPDYLYALNNLGASLKGQERIEIYERILRKEPSFFNFIALRVIYYFYLDELKDPARAAAFLAEWERRLPGAYVFDRIRAADAWNKESDYRKAEQFYLKAVEKKTDDFDVYSDLTNLRLNHLSDAATPVDTRAGYLQLIYDYIKAHPDSDEALLYLGDMFRDVFKDRYSAFDVYRRAFAVRPTGETAQKAFFALAAYTPQRAQEFLLQADRTLPNNHKILTALGQLYSNQVHDPARAENYYRRAIEFSYTLSDQTSNTQSLAINVYEQLTFEFDRAEKIYLSYLDKVAAKNNLLTQLYLNRRNAQDFRASLKYLEQLEQYLRTKKDINEVWFLDRRKELDLYLGAEERAARYYRENPFLKVWRERFRDNAQQSVVFAPNSDQLAPAESAKLAQFATLMREAEKYIFNIEGYAGASEDESGKEPLSLRRARTVVRLLSEAHGVPLSQMKAVGRGASSAQLDAAASSRDRRVEILPVGNTANPAVVATAALETNAALAVSPDGRLLATGYYPMQLWDAQRKIKLKDLGRGGLERKFSPDGRYLATSSNYKEVGGHTVNTLLIYDVRSGLVAGQVPWPDEIGRLDWSPDSRQIVFTTAEYNKIIIYDMATRKLVRARISPGKMLDGGDRILWTRDGKYIVAGRPQLNELHVYHAADLTPARNLDGVSWPHALANTGDARYLVCADNARVLSVWDTRDFSLKQLPIPVLAGSIQIHPTKPLAAINDFGGRANNRLILVDLTRMEIVAERGVGDESGARFGFSGDGGQLYRAWKDKIEILDGATLKEISSIVGEAARPLASAADAKNGYYLSSDEEGVNVWDVLTGKKVHAWASPVKRLARLGDETGQFLGLIEDESVRHTRVLRFDTDKFQQDEALVLDFKVDRWLSNAQFVAFAGKPFTRNDVGAENGVILVYDRKSMALKAKIEIPLVTDYLVYRSLNDSGFSSFALNEAGTETVVTTYWQDGFGHADTNSKEARVFNLADGRLARSIKLTVEIAEVAYNRDEPKLLDVRTRGGTYVYERATGNYVRWENLRAYENRLRLRQQDAELRWSKEYLRYLDTKTGTTKQLNVEDYLVAVEIYEDKNLLITLGGANEISFYNLSTLDKGLSIIAKKNNEWIAYAPTGEFVSSMNGTDKVFWLVGDELLEFAALAERFEQPKLIAAKLNAIFNATGTGAGVTVATARGGPGIDTDLFVLPYNLSLVSSNQVETTAALYKLEVKIEKAKAGMPEPVLEFAQQGRVLEEGAAGQGAGLAKVRQLTPQALVLERSFDLVEGLNVIQVSLNYKNAKLLTQTVFVNRRGAAGGASARANSELWFLGIGVSKYENNSFNLKFADRDVKFVSDSLKRQEGLLYKKVHVKTLLNDEATAKNVKAAMFEFLRLASAQDVVVIFVAGHGAQDNDQALYLMTHESDLTKPYTGLDMSDFHRFLMKRPANQKVVVCMDICHAGAYEAAGEGRRGIAGAVTAEDAVKQLSQGTGLIVMASSTGRESSLEHESYNGGHGAFSAAMLEALEGIADDKSGDGNGFISIAELQVYVSRRVPEITNGRQHPMTPFVQQLRDFPFAAIAATKPLK